MSHFRKCPVCSQSITHKSARSMRQAERKSLCCQSCGAKRRIEKHGLSDAFLAISQKGCQSGSSNPFFGHSHTEATKEKIRNRDKSFFETKEYKEKMSRICSGSGNPMFGKTVYQAWLTKYGAQQADELLQQFKDKQRVNSSGPNNPMYGRPSPNGSGNGWSGWYRDWYFRSLKELSYVVNVLESAKKQWVSAESIKIPYLDWKGVQRNYLPDFLVESTLLVEVKPVRLRSSITVQLKQEAALEYCKSKGWEYVIVDAPDFEKDQIISLHSSGAIRFSDRYEKKYKEKYLQT